MYAFIHNLHVLELALGSIPNVGFTFDVTLLNRIQVSAFSCKTFLQSDIKKLAEKGKELMINKKHS